MMKMANGVLLVALTAVGGVSGECRERRWDMRIYVSAFTFPLVLVNQCSDRLGYCCLHREVSFEYSKKP